MCGVLSTRAPSRPRKLIATSPVTRIFFSWRLPMGMFTFISAMLPFDPSHHAAHVSERALHARQGILRVDLVLQVDAALVSGFSQRAEQGRERNLAFAYVALAVLAGEIAQIFDVHVEEPRSGLGDHCHRIRTGS